MVQRGEWQLNEYVCLHVCRTDDDKHRRRELTFMELKDFIPREFLSVETLSLAYSAWLQNLTLLHWVL